MRHVIVNLHGIMTGMQYSEMYITLAKPSSHRIPKKLNTVRPCFAHLLAKQQTAQK